MAHRGTAGTALTDYPRPSVAVDTAVLTVDGGQLSVLLVGEATADEFRLPGTFLHPGETLADAVLRSLRTKAAITGRTPRQLRVFDDPARDPRGWVLSVAHVDVVPVEQLGEAASGANVRLVPVADVVSQGRDGRNSAAKPLPYDHPAIVAEAVAWMRRAYAQRPDPGGLLTGAFTLRELRLVHQVVAGEGLVRDTFRRFMEPQLAPTGEMSSGRGRPSRLFRRPPE